MRSVDLSGLPRDARHFIAWNQSEGYDVPFHYDDQQGLLTILRAGKGNHGEAVPLRYNYDKPEKPRISRVFGYLARFFILFQTEKSSREVIIS